jgi:hypothetical protein
MTETTNGISQENKSAAERIVTALTSFTDHLVHNRPGIVVPDGRARIGVRWEQCIWKQQGNDKIIYLRKDMKTPFAKLLDNDDIVAINTGDKMGVYRCPKKTNKLYPEVAEYLYKQLAEIHKLDNELAAKYASYLFVQQNKDLKTIAAAFMLVQDRHGEAVRDDNGTVEFYDEDYREVGEAMLLNKGQGYASMEPKLIARVGHVLRLPQIAQVNRDLGFTTARTNPAMGRYISTVKKWLYYREVNPQMLQGLVKSGQTKLVQELCRISRYKPMTAEFFRTLGWDQTANETREIGIGQDMSSGKSTFEGLSEKGICEKIVSERISHKRVVGMLPKDQPMTRAIMGACLESGMSSKDIITLAPTLEDLGMLTIPAYKAMLDEAMKDADDQRARNIAKNMASQDLKSDMEEAADNAATKVMEEATRNLRVYMFVDISGSMDDAISSAKRYAVKMLAGFPKDKLTITVFNVGGRILNLRSSSKAGVEQAFRGIGAGGGTVYSSGVIEVVKASNNVTMPTEEEDTLFLIIGDQQGESGAQFAQYIEASGLRPSAFGFLYIPSKFGGSRRKTVEDAARHLQIPCFPIEEEMFASDDPYVINQTFRALIEATPVGKQISGTSSANRRKSLVDTILETKLLAKPHWAV